MSGTVEQGQPRRSITDPAESIENRLHWVPDVAVIKGHDRWQPGTGPENFMTFLYSP
jgi:hypothetical protein